MGCKYDTLDMLGCNSEPLLAAPIVLPLRIPPACTARIPGGSFLPTLGGCVSTSLTTVTVKTSSPNALIEGIRRNSSNPLEKRFQALDQAYQSADAQFKIYTYEPDYSYIDPVYFMDFDEIIPEIRKDKETNEKWLIFVDDERQGSKLASRICFGEGISSVYLVLLDFCSASRLPG